MIQCPDHHQNQSAKPHRRKQPEPNHAVRPNTPILTNQRLRPALLTIANQSQVEIVLLGDKMVLQKGTMAGRPS